MSRGHRDSSFRVVQTLALTCSKDIVLHLGHLSVSHPLLNTLTERYLFRTNAIVV